MKERTEKRIEELVDWLRSEDFIPETDVDEFAVLTKTANKDEQWTEATMELIKNRYNITLILIQNEGTGWDNFKIIRG
jgi:hypothetical protein